MQRSRSAQGPLCRGRDACGPEAVMSPSYQCCPEFGHRVVRSSEPSCGGSEDFSVAVLSSCWPWDLQVQFSDTGQHKSSPPPFIFLSFIYLFFLWGVLYHKACQILVLQAGIQPMPPALGAQSLNHWMSREVSHYLLFLIRACILE